MEFSKRLKLFSCLACLLVFFWLFLLTGFAESFNLYSSMSSSDSIAQNLIGLYLNQDDFDPFNQYYCCRVGQYDYRLFYAKNLAEYYKYIRYSAVSGQGPAYVYQYDYGSGSDLQINTGGYVGVGNIEHSVLSDKAENFKAGYVIIALWFLITIFVIFKVLRLRIHSHESRGWRL